MRSVVGALLVLSGSVLVGAALIAESIRESWSVARAAAALGALIGLVGLWAMFFSLGSRLPVSLPPNEK